MIAGNFSENDSELGTQFDGQLFDLQIYQGMLSDGAITMLAANARQFPNLTLWADHRFHRTGTYARPSSKTGNLMTHGQLMLT